VRRSLYRVALPVFQAYQLIVRPRTRSVACVITHGGEVLLVRHTYRDQERWTVPGGLRRSGESAEAAATREMEEELGRRLTSWRTLRSSRRRSRSGLHLATCVHAEVGSRSVHPDAGELARTAWFPVGELPEAMSAEAVKMIRQAGLDLSAGLA
jgi:ADP-ribose pyrophosphatase YjhB (NUDIX family)